MDVTTALTLPARPDPVLDALVRGELVHELSYAFGGPFHVVLPGRFDANAAGFAAVLGEEGVDGRLYYAKKANKAAAWVERCAVTPGLGVDVSSAGELRAALASGVRGEAIVVTGPAKSDELLHLAVLHNCLITVDALDELDRLIAHARGGPSVRVMVRRLPPGQPDSRFGLGDTELEAALERCRDNAGVVRMEGFAFHLSGYEVQARADLAAESLGWCRRARELGLPAGHVGIGGGFAVDYVGAEEWERFLGAHRPEDFHAGKTFSEFYPYHSPVAGADALRAVLRATPAGEGAPLGTLLREAGVTLLLEPGRALLDGAGFSVFRVQGVKLRTHAGEPYGIITVDGTSLSLSEQWFGSEFLPDPVLVRRDPGARDDPGEPFRACVGAATCLESDMLTWRKVVFPARPVPGDLIVYPNTAGYQMDSNESPFHDLPLPPKIVIEDTDPGAGRPRWRLDRHPAR